jgi:hypothetical protein
MFSLASSQTYNIIDIAVTESNFVMTDLFNHLLIQ